MKEILFAGITGWDVVSVILTLVILIWCAIEDKKSLIIPNYITFPGILIGTVLCVISKGFCEMGLRFIAVAVLFLLFMIRLLSGGDIKLLMTITMLEGILPMLITLIVGNVILLLAAFIRNKDEAISAIRDGLFLVNGWTNTTYYPENCRKVALAPYLLYGFIAYYIGRIVINLIIL